MKLIHRKTAVLTVQYTNRCCTAILTGSNSALRTRKSSKLSVHVVRKKSAKSRTEQFSGLCQYATCSHLCHAVAATPWQTGFSSMCLVSVGTRQAAGGSPDRLEKVTPMEIEVKVRLHDKASYDKLAALLKADHKATYAQENVFFDGSNSELSSRRVVLRVRLYNKDEKATITIKGKSILQDGIGRASEVEDTLDPKLARGFLSDPDALLSHPAEIIQNLKKTYELQGLKCLGGFLNKRNVFSWEGQVLELDKTQFEWGTLHEIEIETTQPEDVRTRLEKFLAENGIEYSYSQTTKFANFINKTLL